MKIANLVFAASLVLTDSSVDAAVSGVRGSKGQKDWEFCSKHGTNEEQCNSLRDRPEKCVWTRLPGDYDGCISATTSDDIEAEKDWDNESSSIGSLVALRALNDPRAQIDLDAKELKSLVGKLKDKKGVSPEKVLEKVTSNLNGFVAGLQSDDPVKMSTGIIEMLGGIVGVIPGGETLGAALGLVGGILSLAFGAGDHGPTQYQRLSKQIQDAQGRMMRKMDDILSKVADLENNLEISGPKNIIDGIVFELKTKGKVLYEDLRNNIRLIEEEFGKKLKNRGTVSDRMTSAYKSIEKVNKFIRKVWATHEGILADLTARQQKGPLVNKQLSLCANTCRLMLVPAMKWLEDQQTPLITHLEPPHRDDNMKEFEICRTYGRYYVNSHLQDTIKYDDDCIRRVRGIASCENAYHTGRDYYQLLRELEDLASMFLVVLVSAAVTNIHFIYFNEEILDVDQPDLIGTPDSTAAGHVRKIVNTLQLKNKFMEIKIRKVENVVGEDCDVNSIFNPLWGNENIFKKHGYKIGFFKTKENGKDVLKLLAEVDRSFRRPCAEGGFCRNWQENHGWTYVCEEQSDTYAQCGNFPSKHLDYSVAFPLYNWHLANPDSYCGPEYNDQACPEGSCCNESGICEHCGKHV
mmetsp:Transcript_8258/g.15361  ORF Transcript_8258/g.15361 Transcript_8258/m.15361 type:complete len:634 (-) Transcript_8258:709-2610(-)